MNIFVIFFKWAFKSNIQEDEGGVFPIYPILAVLGNLCYLENYIWLGDTGVLESYCVLNALSLSLVAPQEMQKR